MKIPLGSDLRAIRIAKGMIAKWVADRAGLKRSYLSRIELDRTRLTLEQYVAICIAMDEDPGALITAGPEQMKSLAEMSGVIQRLDRIPNDLRREVMAHLLRTLDELLHILALQGESRATTSSGSQRNSEGG